MSRQMDPREVVRQMVREKEYEKAVGRTLRQGGQEVRVTREEDGAVRFSLPTARKSYVLKSGRIFEKRYAAEPAEAQGERPSPIKAHRQGATPANPDEAPPSPVETQLGYKGLPEQVDTGVYRNRVTCACGNVRWVKNADLFQVKKCKPCTVKERRARRHQRRKKAKAAG